MRENAALRQLGEKRERVAFAIRKNMKRLEHEIEKLKGEHAAHKESLLHMEKALADEKQKFLNLQEISYSQLLAVYSLNRKSYWKRVRRFFRFANLNECRMLRDSGYVDPNYYFTQYPGLIAGGLSAAKHYLLFGAQEGKNPSSKFNTVEYLAENPQLAYLGVNPLVHFILSENSGAS